MACRKVTREEVTVEERGNGTGEEKRSCDRGKDDGKKGSESRCVEREINNRNGDRKKEAGKKGTTEKTAGEKSTTR